MNERFNKLTALLKELFQLDQPDLDFGFYRVMHAKSVEVSAFLEKDLLPQVKAAFAHYQPADKAAVEEELAKVTAAVKAAQMDPEQSPKVKELRATPANDAVDLDALEAEVYDHLYSFFRRYYSATVGQAVKGNERLTNLYARSIHFDYSYRWFYGDGFGKDHSAAFRPSHSVNTYTARCSIWRAAWSKSPPRLSTRASDGSSKT